MLKFLKYDVYNSPLLSSNSLDESIKIFGSLWTIKRRIKKIDSGEKLFDDKWARESFSKQRDGLKQRRMEIMKAKVKKGYVRFVNELTEILKALLRKSKNDRLSLGNLGNKISLMLGSKKNCLKKEI